MATLFTIGQQTGSKRYSSWNVASSDINIDNVDVSNIYTEYDLTALVGTIPRYEWSCLDF